MKQHRLLALAITCLVLAPIALCQDDSAKGVPEPIYEIGGSVKPPRQIYAPGPEYTTKARKERQQGVVVLKMVVGVDGLTRDIKVVRSLSTELDGAATVAVKKWKFAPATKDGEPVAVRMNVEVSFNL
jgi:TonB family protein